MDKKYKDMTIDEIMKSVWASLDKQEENSKKRQAEYEKRQADLEKTIKKVSIMMGNHQNNIGEVAEEYFFNSFENGKTNFFGQNFDEINQKVKGIKKGFKDEYDILLINGESIGIIEVKFKAHVNDIPEVIDKARTFRVNFPEYQNHKVYLGLASMSFYPELTKKCKSEGIAIIKQVGEVLVFYDKHIKVH